ncbi:MAG TPA: NADH-quinone oxidoreductase subunit C [Candidatus Omnitrophota bacterium]|nr:NADH-quinone oxidoreductase subunit C [Candidatus Omnitrophota bacterium]
MNPKVELSQVVQTIREKFPEAITEERPAAIVIKKEALLAVAQFLKSGELAFDNLHCVTGVDWKDKMEVVYHLYSFKNRFMLTLKVFLSLEDLSVESLCGLWKSANWLERETYDFFGIKFLNHPDPRRILNPDEWTDWPLRKNFDRPDFVRLPQSEGLKGGG